MGGGEILRFHWAERAIAAALLYCRLLYGRMSSVGHHMHVLGWAGRRGPAGFWILGRAGSS
jgi:hypothetical protein